MPEDTKQMADGWRDMLDPDKPASAVASDAVDRMADAIIALINSKPQSVVTFELIDSFADQIADRIIAIINSKPQSPTKDEIASLIAAMLAPMVYDKTRSPTKEEIAAVLNADMARRDLVLMTHDLVLRDTTAIVHVVKNGETPRRFDLDQQFAFLDTAFREGQDVLRGLFGPMGVVGPGNDPRET